VLRSISLKLLDIVNRTGYLLVQRPRGLTVVDAEILSANASRLRRIIESKWRERSSYSNKQNPVTGNWVLLKNHAPWPDAPPAPKAWEMLTSQLGQEPRKWNDSLPPYEFHHMTAAPGYVLTDREREVVNRIETQGLPKEFGLLTRTRGGPDETQEVQGKRLTDRLVRELQLSDREESMLPEWPEAYDVPSLSTAGARLLQQWRKQWEMYRHRHGARCASPRCSAPGGRFFVPRTNERDCPYCRRGASKTTRWRRRRKV